MNQKTNEGMSDNTEANKAAAKLLGYDIGVRQKYTEEGQLLVCEEDCDCSFTFDIFDESKGDCTKAVIALGEKHGITITCGNWVEAGFCWLPIRRKIHVAWKLRGKHIESYSIARKYSGYIEAVAAALIAVKE